MPLRTYTLLFCLLILAGTSRWSQADVAGLPDVIVREALSLKSLPQGTYTPVQAWQVEKAGHNTGHLVDDPGAKDGKAWDLMPGTDQPECAALRPVPGNPSRHVHRVLPHQAHGGGGG